MASERQSSGRRWARYRTQVQRTRKKRTHCHRSSAGRHVFASQMPGISFGQIATEIHLTLPES